MSTSSSTSSESPQEAPAIVTQSGLQLLQNKILDVTNQLSSGVTSGSQNTVLGSTGPAGIVSLNAKWLTITGPNGNIAWMPYWQ